MEIGWTITYLKSSDTLIFSLLYDLFHPTLRAKQRNCSHTNGFLRAL